MDLKKVFELSKKKVEEENKAIDENIRNLEHDSDKKEKKKVLVNSFFSENTAICDKLRKLYTSGDVVDKAECFIECFDIADYIINNSKSEINEPIEKCINKLEPLRYKLETLVYEYKDTILGKDNIKEKIKIIFTFGYSRIIRKFILLIIESSVVSKPPTLGYEGEEEIFYGE